MKPSDRILVALDTPDVSKAAALAREVEGAVGGVKLGLEFFVANGPDKAQDVAGSTPLFLDLKFHDIPNTVAGAVRSAVTNAKPGILNVHASGGLEMMRRAAEANVEAADAVGIAPPMLIAVTVLTSMDDADLSAVGQSAPALDQVVRLAKLTQEAGLDGVVCSALEIEAIRAACGADFKLVVPGIRPASADAGDQKRVMTPSQAVDAGADYLVIGRPITQADDPAAAARAIADELNG